MRQTKVGVGSFREWNLLKKSLNVCLEGIPTGEGVVLDVPTGLFDAFFDLTQNRQKRRILLLSLLPFLLN